MSHALQRFVFLASVLLACGSPAPEPAVVSTQTQTQTQSQATRLPETNAEVDAQKASGVTWSNVAVREHYLKLVARIGPANDDWKKAGMPAEDRARKAFQMRHDARMLTRRMMTDPSEVEGLRARDQRRYGHPDGPTFEELVEHNKKKGLVGDAIYEKVIESSQKTDPIMNELVGPSSQ